MYFLNRIYMPIHCHLARQSLWSTWQSAGAAAPGFPAAQLQCAAHGQHDKIVMKGMVFHGYHGALPEENTLGQKFYIDATLWADIACSGQTDNLQDTIDYRQVYSEIKQVVEGPPKALQEAVADEIARRLLQLDPRVSAVQLYIRKPHVALPGVLESVGIDIFRQKSED